MGDERRDCRPSCAVASPTSLIGLHISEIFWSNHFRDNIKGTYPDSFRLCMRADMRDGVQQAKDDHLSLSLSLSL